MFRRRRKLILFLIIALAVIGTGVFVYTHGTKPNDANDLENNDTNSNPFQTIKDPKALLIKEMKKVYSSEGGYWDNWDRKYNIVFAHIVEIDQSNNEILADIKPPNFEPFSYENKRVYIACPVNQTIEVSSSNPIKNIMAEDFNILEKAEIGDIILGYCSDEQCLNIGRACALVKTNF
jgi:hypothetical protein